MGQKKICRFITPCCPDNAFQIHINSPTRTISDQKVMAGIPNFDQYFEQFQAVATLEL